jgi:hypothetical protein
MPTSAVGRFVMRRRFEFEVFLAVFGACCGQNYEVVAPPPNFCMEHVGCPFGACLRLCLWGISEGYRAAWSCLQEFHHRTALKQLQAGR